jgi:integral membrane protein (TIGR01906 family)
MFKLGKKRKSSKKGGSLMLMQRLYTLSITLLVPILLLLGGLRLLMSEAYLPIAYGRPNFPADLYGFSQEDRLRLAPLAVRYLVGREDVSFLADLTTEDGQKLYNDRELKHMVDVQVVTGAALGALAALLIFSVGLIFIGLRNPQGRQALCRGLIQGGLLMLFLLMALVVYVFLDWDHFFTAFHDMFFASGTWQFAYSDTLIRLFPIRFWQDAALTLGALCTFGAVSLMMIGWAWEKQARLIPKPPQTPQPK